MSKTKESFVFYKDWWNAISGMPKDVRGEVCECVIRYAFGNIDADADADAETGNMAAMALRFIAPQIDRDRAKYEATCKVRQEAGRLGGAPKGNTNAAKQTQPAENNQNQAEPTVNNQNQAKQPDNDNVNETENVNDNKNENVSESVCDNGQSDAHAHPQTHVLTPEEEIFKKFQSWLTVYAPTVMLFQEPLDAAGFDWLYKKYGGARLKQCAADIHNKEAYLKNRNALNTFKLWIRNVKI